MGWGSQPYPITHTTWRNTMQEYATNLWINAIQDTKKTWVNTWIKEETMNKPLNEFIVAQTEFTKEAFKQTTNFANAAGEAFSKMVQAND